GVSGMGTASALQAPPPKPAPVEESARTAVTDGHAWTAEADEELREGIGMGLTLDELADHLEMSEDAVVARCEQLGLRPQGS
ncbi:MAG TPA: ATP-dependent helicase, partial [Dermacoccus sp.]|nr:ATP-dependent helicase [Dermacoccus sp.]